MKISYKWLKKYFDKELPPADELVAMISAHAFEVEGIERAGDDYVLDIKILPDKAHYALCHKGIAREVSAIAKIDLRDIPKPEVDGSAQVLQVPRVSVTIEEKDLCSRYMARRIDGVKISESPKYIKEGLEAIGARTINSVVDATNYVMFDIGQPLHVFDADKVKGGIIVRKAKKGEKITLLDGRELELSTSDLCIADDEGLLAIAGVKGGKKAEVTAETKNIILESANFNPVSVRRTSTRLNIRNDSSKRFENEIIPELAGEAMDMVSALIIGYSGKAGQITDEWVRTTESRSVTVLPAYVRARLGIDIGEKEITEILTRLGCAISDKGDALHVIPPMDRLDMNIQDDFVDEIARIKGYDAVASALPPELEKKTPVSALFYWSEKIKNILVSDGFSESLFYSLVPSGDHEIEYPLASDKSALRTSIITRLEKALAANALNADLLGLDVIKMFEIGNVFPKSGEKTVLAMGVSLVKKKKGVSAEGILADSLGRLGKELGIAIDVPAQGKGTGALSAMIEMEIGGLIDKLEKAGNDSGTSGISDLDFRALPKDQKYIQFSQFPFITRDIALFVPDSIGADEVWKAIEKGIKSAGAENLLARHSLFDTFKKDGKTSYAYRMVFQAMDRTLTDEEANSIMEKVYASLKEKGWEVR